MPVFSAASWHSIVSADPLKAVLPGSPQAGKYTTTLRPLLFCEDGKPTLNFSRRIITGSGVRPRYPRSPPPITEAQAETLDAIPFTGEKHCLEMNLEPKDI